MIYFDHAASTPLGLSVLEVLNQSWKNDFANPSSAHKLGKDLSKKIEKIRLHFLTHLNGKENGQFYFLSSATEANNTFIKGLDLKSQDCLFFSRSDHPSMVAPADFLTLEKGVEVFDMSSSLSGNGPNYEEIERQIVKKKPKVFLLSHVNNISGQKLDIVKWGQILNKHNVHFHLDASQSFGKFLINIKAAKIGSLSLSGHKMGGPKGIAGLYLKKGVHLKPLLHGGNHEFSLRSSTVAAPLVFALDQALREKENKIKENFTQVQSHYEFLKKNIQSLEDRAFFPFEESEISPYILSMILPLCSSDIIMRFLEDHDVYISSSSACSSRQKGENKVLSALQIPLKHHKHILRISLSESTSHLECEKFLSIFSHIIKDLSSLL